MNIKEKLRKYNQEQLLTFYNELNIFEKLKLKADINKIDFYQINNLYMNSFNDEEIDINKISNLKCLYNINNDDLNKYNKVGEDLIKHGKYAIIIMSGGNASRLGLDYPKGCLKLKIDNKEKFLFEIYIDQLKEIYNKYNVYIPLYIMTSTSNNDKIMKFFEENNYFNYKKDKIKFFKQHNLPILDTKGKILLKNKSSIVFGPNGNGDVFYSLKENNIINDMKKNNIEYVLFSTVDNVLTKLVDFNFIGATIANNYNLSSKTIQIKDNDDKKWIFCKYNNKPFMLPKEYLNDKLFNKKIDNEYIYRNKNITYHLISINNIEKFSNIELKYHRAFKKNDYLNLNGQYIISNEPNSFKFEKFIFDAFEYNDDMLLYRIDENEFYTIKNKEDLKKIV